MLHLPRHSQSPSVPGLSLQLRSGAMTHTRLHCTIWAAQGQVPLLCIISKRNSSVSIACHIGAAAQRCLLLRWCCTQCFPSIKKWRMGMPQLAQTQPRATCCSCGIGPAGSRVRPPHLPSQSHVPSGRAKCDDAGTLQGQQDVLQILASGTPGLAPVALAAGMFHSSVLWKSTMYFQLGSTSHLQLPFKN